MHEADTDDHGGPGGYSSPRQAELNEELWRLLEAGWQSWNLDRRQVMKLAGVHESSFRRYARRVPPTTKSRENLKRLAALTPWPHAVLAIHEELVTEESRQRQVARSTPGRVPIREIPRVLYGRIDRDPDEQPKRATTIDQIVVTAATASEIDGRIMRVFPPTETSMRWRFKGVHSEARLLLMFNSLLPENPSSSGLLDLSRRSLTSDGLAFSGSYVRRDGVRREYHWYLSRPQFSMTEVGLLDVDNTLLDGWIVRPWLDFLLEQGLPIDLASLEAIDKTLEGVRTEGRSHDEAANVCADHYAKAVELLHADAVTRLARRFVDRIMPHLRPWVRPLIDELLAGAIAPVLVSGAPAPVIDALAERLGIDKKYGLRVSQGAVDENPGTTEGKRRVVDLVLDDQQAQRSALLAIGDSESDLPMLNAAQVRVLVGAAIEPSPGWDSRLTMRRPAGNAWPNVGDEIRARVLQARAHSSS